MASSLNASTSGGGGVIVSSDASGNLDIQSGGSTVVAVTSTSVAVTGTGKFATTIGVGNATPAASGSGITFPASQSASSDANTLDDYEEGTWTPVITAQAGSLTSYTSSGTYTKVGRTVYINGKFTVVTIGTASGYAQVTGYPFTSASGFETLGVARENSGNIYYSLLGAASNAGYILATANGAILWPTATYNWTITYNT
jgi:hypothetical protein